ncbi:MAG: hypothetical protein O2950_11225 [Proteobacteria bacterium]|jgi:hypothetical protein|nr:hypothetical protein [Pseudomonadota bacterium]MDA1352837.1 hypothetical protein [Pseudomonadota bacterium]
MFLGYLLHCHSRPSYTCVLCGACNQPSELVPDLLPPDASVHGVGSGYRLTACRVMGLGGSNIVLEGYCDKGGAQARD